ncbi:hypothetical protein AAFF_G00115070 [Aldrovandia affinis]|uniref:Non-homologous end-joining factor 1 n=1 Tax=Aldrovandia affinis TaxID=143900 RepID=A0AAD7WAD1_9TELE|nr:hypothetical protein AAFF_G00115070 [Aldrovandia affinis]
MLRAGVPDDFLRQPWAPVSLGGLQLLAKSSFRNTTYRVLLSDMQCVWEEEMTAAAIQDRAQDLNRRLRAPVSAFFSHLRDVASPRLTGRGEGEAASGVNAAEFSLLHSQNRLDVRLKSELAGVPFYWEFRCTTASMAVVCSHFVHPLLAVSEVLLRQVGELEDLLARKDAEIQDYRESGAELSRGRLETKLFNKQKFREDFITQVLPQLCAEQDCLRFNADLQELYSTVMTAQRSLRKRKSSDSHGPDNHGQNSPSAPEGPSSLSVPGAELGALGPKENSSDGPEPAEPEGPGNEQTAPINPALSDRPASRPRKKKAKGLFR